MTAFAADPTATNYTADECCGTHIPYPARQHDTALPDTLAPVFINHVGRHGARFPSSPSNTLELLRTLHRADSAKALTPLGKDLMKLADLVAARSHNRWGALDSLGMAEQRGIASRMFKAYPSLFKGGNVSAISSYSPRCVMSMYEFTHQLDRLNNNVEIITSSGRQNSQLMRPFDLDTEYLDWRDSRAWEEPYNMAYETTAPTAPARRLTGDFLSSEDARRLSMTAYDVLSCLPSMGMANELAKYFTPEEYNALWALSNLRFYLRYSANTLSTLPADIASALLMNLISTTDAAVLGDSPQTVMLRFGHAETLMPLLSLMRLLLHDQLLRHHGHALVQFPRCADGCQPPDDIAEIKVGQLLCAVRPQRRACSTDAQFRRHIPPLGHRSPVPQPLSASPPPALSRRLPL